MATLDGEGLHKPQDIMMSPWAVQRYDEPGGHNLPTTFDIDYQNLSLLLQEAAILYPQCAKPKLYPTTQPYIPVPVTTPVVPVSLRSGSVTVGVVTKDPYSEGNRSGQGPNHTTDYREYDTSSAVPLRQGRHNNKLPLSDACCGTAVNMGSSRQEPSTESLWTGIKPAVLLNGTWTKPRHVNKDGHIFRKLEFEVPLDHHHHHSSQKDALKLHAELVDSFPDPKPTTPDVLSSPISPQKPIILYLCGGPGDGNPSDRVPELNKFCIDRGYQVLYVHYRGTGLSPLFSDSAAKNKVMRMSDQDKANYLAKFRQDNIVRDLEAIRLCLEKELPTKIKWTLLGQSFGGWVATTYLSFLPQSLEAVYISAGMPPLGKTPREVYEKTYSHIVKRNEDYFNEYFPEDQEHVRTIVEHLRGKAPMQKGVDGQPFRGYELYGENGERKGCYLTYQTFMTLGRTFGSAPVVRRDRDMDEEEYERPSLASSIGALTINPSKSSLASSTTHISGTPPLSASYRSSSTSFTSLSSLPDTSLTPEIPLPYQKLHNLITRLISDLNSSKGISSATLTIYTHLESFALHRRPLYALLHEAIYCSSTCPLTRQASNWAATEVALFHPSGGFSWLNTSSSPSSSSTTIPSKRKGDKEKMYFTGETLHPSPTLSSLGGSAIVPFLGAADILARKGDWPALYDLSSLNKNRERGVKVRAVAYQEDMYVDLELSKQAAGMIGGCELVVCPFREWGHGSIKETDKTGRVLGWLFDGFN
ncbi:hypothetical protein B0H65DRAFT_463513 [Neurospora tetraspora]|uniref:AB hydrolase-1 domain-containing protein n=1 Tax=Neurospora tetraspora TaxID=94610 RepID=A0AAE0JJ14_9PEZI|nr:hypothetical protein B0H65DRAFT_463513 [Neurospora tetraspora]